MTLIASPAIDLQYISIHPRSLRLSKTITSTEFNDANNNTIKNTNSHTQTIRPRVSFNFSRDQLLIGQWSQPLRMQTGTPWNPAVVKERLLDWAFLYRYLVPPYRCYCKATRSTIANPQNPIPVTYLSRKSCRFSLLAWTSLTLEKVGSIASTVGGKEGF